MGAATSALTAASSGARLTLMLVVALALAPTAARAESCTGVTGGGGRFATCFDPGNRLSITAGSDGFGGGIALRQIVKFEDDPDLAWKLEHTILEARHAGFAREFAGVLYRGRFIRHTRDGRIVLPLSPPKKIFLPFDIGAQIEAGRVTWRGDTSVGVGVVKTALLVDLWRSRTFRRRLAFGPVARWDIAIDRATDLAAATIGGHAVSAFSTGMANLHIESAHGLLVGDLVVEAGKVWRSDGGWVSEARVEATLERTVLAINDRPIAVVLGARYESATDEAIARVGARIVLFQQRDSRVSLAAMGR